MKTITTNCVICNKEFEKSCGFIRNYCHIPNICGGGCFLGLLRMNKSKCIIINPIQEHAKEKWNKLKSDYEKRFALWLIQNKVAWLYEPRKFRLKDGSIYVPDFYLIDYWAWVEVKGLWEPSAYSKFLKFKYERKSERCAIYLADREFLDRIGCKKPGIEELSWKQNQNYLISCL